MSGEDQGPRIPPSAADHLEDLVRGETDARKTTAPIASFGRYRIEDQLGRGGFGTVYRAVDTRLHRPVALKVLPLVAEEDTRKRFMREARIAAQLKHPGIVGVYDVGEIQGQMYIAMELVSGTALDRAPAPLSRRRSLLILRDVARALQFLHERGVVHRDIKPANILLGPNGRPVIVDFGIAREMGAATRVTSTGAVMGTLGYLSPEQVAGDPGLIDTRTDIYSLGVVLYRLVTGRLPFEAANSFEAMRAIIEKEPPSPRGLVPTVPPELEAVILKALEKDKGKRYQSAVEFARDLEALLRKEPVTARRPGRLGPWSRRRKTLVLAASGLLLAAIAFVAFRPGNAEPASSPVKKTPETATPSPQPARAAELSQQSRDLLQVVRQTRRKKGKESFLKELQAVERLAQEALSHDERHAGGYIALIQVHTLRGDHRKAFETLRLMRLKDPKAPDLLDLGWEAQIRTNLIAAESLPSSTGFDTRRFAKEEGFDDLLRRLADRSGPPTIWRWKDRLHRALKTAADGDDKAAQDAARELAELEAKSPVSVGDSILTLLAKGFKDLPERGPVRPFYHELVTAAWQIRFGVYPQAGKKIQNFLDREIVAPPAATFLQAHVYLSRNDVKGALDLLKRCRAPRDQQWRVDAFSGVCRLESAPAKAAEIFGRVLAERPGESEVEYHLAVALLALGKPEEAMAHLRRAAPSAKLFGPIPAALVDRSPLRFQLSRMIFRKDPALEPLRKDSKWREELQRMAGP